MALYSLRSIKNSYDKVHETLAKNAKPETACSTPSKIRCLRGLCLVALRANVVSGNDNIIAV